jgi:hypothetical protein
MTRTGSPMYVAGSDFTGGGCAPFGIELGLSAGYKPGSGRFVPIQSSVARLGLAVRF